MKRGALRATAFAALAVLFLLRHDLWLWNEPARVAGLPAGLAYHVAFCLATALVLALLVTVAWPPPGGGQRS